MRLQRGLGISFSQVSVSKPDSTHHQATCLEILLIESSLDGTMDEAEMWSLDGGLQAVREYYRALMQKIVVDGRAYILAPIYTTPEQRKMKEWQEKALSMGLLFGEVKRIQCAHG